MNGQPPWLAEAWLEFGQTEIAGRRHNPRITAFFRELGHDDHARDEVAWCAAFVGACLERSGLASTRSLMARSYANSGRALSQERLGALVILSRGRNPAFGHVGFLVGWSKTKLWLLGGNQSDSVSVEGFDRTRLVSMRWPTELKAVDEEKSEDTFQIALKHVLEMEGGFTNDPHDPGGPTNKGITLANLAAWRKQKLSAANSPRLMAELKKISDEEVSAIYSKRYWHPAGCRQMPAQLAFFHFDAAVNHGVFGATKMLQEAVGANVDGEIGPETRGKIEAMPILKLLEVYAAIRRKKYRALPHFWRFGRGWLRRVDRTLKRAGEVPANPARSTATENTKTNRTGDDDMTTTQQQHSKWWGESMTIWGALITAAAAVLPTIGPIIGLDLDAGVVRMLGEQMLTVVQALTALFGTALTVYGRSRAALPLVRRSITLKL